MLRLLVQALQDPPLCSSTISTAVKIVQLGGKGRDLNGESCEVNAGADHPLVVVGIHAHSVRFQVKRVLTILHLNTQGSTSVSVRIARSKMCVNPLVPERRITVKKG
jgi:hypothetical protein